MATKNDTHGYLWIEENELFKLSKPLYSILKAENYWGVAIEEQTVNDLQVCSAVDNAALYL